MSEKYVSYCPYRVCPLGAHVDHQLGWVTGFAIDRGVKLTYEITLDGTVDIVSKNFEGHCAFNVNHLPEREYIWSDYVVAAVWALNHRDTDEHNFAPHNIKYGVKGVVEGNLPVGGLSSSAAVIITYMNAFCYANEIVLSKEELIDVALMAERKFIGLNVGKLDQSCEVYCKADRLLYLDTQNDKYELVKPQKKPDQFEIAIIFSGKSRELTSSAYNARVDECKAAAYALKAYAGMEYGKMKDAYLREIPRSVYEEYKDKIPYNWSKRVQHFYAENARVKSGVKAWANGDLKSFGQLVFESGYSSIYSYETGSSELKYMYELMLAAPGIYGGRFSGAGFNGSSIALVNPDAKEDFERYIKEGYLKKFPQYEKQFAMEFCKTADGVKMDG